MTHRSPHTVLAAISLLVALLCLGTGSAHAQFQLQRVAFADGQLLDISAYPTVRARIRATEAGQPVTLASGSTFLIQGNASLAPASVVVEGQGVHTVQWISSQFGFILTDVIAAHNGGTGVVSYALALDKSKGARVVIRDSANRNVPEFVEFGTVAPGGSDTLKLKIVATEAALLNGEERPILLESVAVDNPAFKVIWKGSYGSPAPPVNIQSPLSYRIDLICEPTSTEAQSGVLTVTFEGGMTQTTMISANPATYPQRTILNLVTPNGGESFAPCQDVPIRWTGMIAGFYAFVELSTDDGQTWTFIDSTADSSILWRVPETLTTTARIRVSQKFQSTQPVWLQGPRAPAMNAAYSADGRYLLIAYRNGVINEWDVATVTRANTYNLPAGAEEPVSLCYVGRSRDVIAGTARPGARGGTLVRFTAGTSAPSATQPLPTDLLVRDVATDQQGATLYVLPQQSARIPRYDPATLAARAPISVNAPIASSALNGNIIGASLLNGEVVLIDAATGSEISRSVTGLLAAKGPYAHRFATSLNGRLVAIAGKQLTQIVNGPKEQRTFIFDTQTNRIVKILYRESSDAVNLTFSPSDAFLGLGFEFNPQFVVYDLMNARTLPPSGSAEGHMNRLTDLAFSPDGATLVSTSIDSSNNALLRRVSSPESDISDAPFSISPVQLRVTTVRLREQLIGSRVDTTLTAEICNTGSVPAIINASYFSSNSWLQIATPVNGDTIQPGACLSLSLTSIPLDTGLITDTLNLEFCASIVRIPFEVRSIDRDLTLLVDFEDFGDVCIGQGRTKRLAMLRNNDTVNLVIDGVFMEGGLRDQFRVIDKIDGAVIPPGGTLEVEIEFLPRELGFDTANVIIRYAGQTAIARVVHVMGRGSGADLLLSHTVLPFIPEIPQRDVMIHNRSANAVTITAADITAGQPFTIVSPLPIEIATNDSAAIRIQYDGGVVSNDAAMDLTVQPCASATTVRLAAYSGSARISLPTVTADPRSDTTSLPITAVIGETVPYNGERFFEGSVRLHPRLFLAREITTTIGTAEILSQDVVNDERVIRFRIQGSFTGTGEIARLVGYAGMAEVDETPLICTAAEPAFGSAVTVTYDPGLLRIVHQDPDRRIVDRPLPPIVRSITPNPASSTAELVMHSTSATIVTLRIVDAQGIDLIAPVQTTLVKGATPLALDVSALPVGVHRVLVISAEGRSTATLVIVR